MQYTEPRSTSSRPISLGCGRAQPHPMAPVIVERSAAHHRRLLDHARSRDGCEQPRRLSWDDQGFRPHRLRDRRTDATSGDHVGEGAVPYGVDEFGIAGALNGAAIELVKAEM